MTGPRKYLFFGTDYHRIKIEILEDGIIYLSRKPGKSKVKFLFLGNLNKFLGLDRYDPALIFMRLGYYGQVVFQQTAEIK